MRTDNPLRGALLISGAGLMFASMGALIRFASQQLDNELVVFLRNLFGLLFLLPLILRQGWGATLRTRRLPLHLVRSLFGLASMYCFFFAIAHLPLADAVLLNFTAPLFIPFIAILWLKERVSVQLALAILIGFVGVIFILKPGSGLYSRVALVGLASGAFAALTMVALRRLSSSEPAFRVVVYYALTCTAVSLAPAVLAWRTPPLAAVAQMAGAGLFATAGQYLLSRGYGYAPASQVGPFVYVAVVFAAAYGWLFWTEVPDWMSLSGTVLIVLAGVLAVRRETVPAGNEP
ncbi:MAG TPA: DMT family transporter [Gammaproteobacteria bacterium]|nr:DMT family transporter [Gammaproteobacteria bacterium]